jgi:D-alanine-D-alanine ligase
MENLSADGRIAREKKKKKKKHEVHDCAFAGTPVFKQHRDFAGGVRATVPIRIEKDDAGYSPRKGPYAADSPPRRFLKQSSDRDATDDRADGGCAARVGAQSDVVFPVLALATNGEDGTHTRGLLELANVPTSGAASSGSAAGMDKAVDEEAVSRSAACPWAHTSSRCAVNGTVDSGRDQADGSATSCATRCSSSQPISAQASGISKAKSDTDLNSAMELALQFDRKTVIEAAVPNAREIECAVPWE